MNRPMEFRIWNGKHYLAGQAFWAWADEQSRKGISLEDTEWPVEQFTGLLDKSAVKIFEGDIVKSGEEVGEVQWCEDAVAWICLWQPQTKSRKGGADNLGSTYPSPAKEIIGNIYENPELLKS